MEFPNLLMVILLTSSGISPGNLSYTRKTIVNSESFFFPFNLPVSSYIPDFFTVNLFF